MDNKIKAFLLGKRQARRVANLSMVLLLLCSFNYAASQNSSHSVTYQNSVSSVDLSRAQFYLKNNSLLPKKVTFIIYQPQQVGNNTIVKWFLPFQKVKFDLPVRSKIYVATDSQVDTVMQGRRIDGDKPFVSVSEKIMNATLPLNKRE